MMTPVRKIHTYNFFWYLLGVVILLEVCYLGWCMGNWAWNKAIDAGLVTHTIYVPYRVEIEKGDTLYSIACRVATSDDHLTNLAFSKLPIRQSTGSCGVACQHLVSKLPIRQSTGATVVS